MNKKKIEEALLEKGIGFEYIKKQKTIGDLRKLYSNFFKQLQRLPKKAKHNNQLTKLGLTAAKKVSNVKI